MTVLDVSIVTVALPSITASLHFSATSLQWVLTAYAITFGGFLLLGGRLGDLCGRRLMFMIGLGLFVAASLVCGLATSPAMLIAARAVEGLGADIIAPATLAIITTTFTEGAERNKALGIWGAMGGAGAAAGVLFGGDPHPLRRVGMDLLRQRAHRGVGAGSHAVSGSGEPRSPGDQTRRPDRRDHGDRWGGRARLRHLASPHRRLELRPDHRAAHRLGGCPRLLRGMGKSTTGSADAAQRVSHPLRIGG
jgi:hypothetical protein